MAAIRRYGQVRFEREEWVMYPRVSFYRITGDLLFGAEMSPKDEVSCPDDAS